MVSENNRGVAKGEQDLLL
ncbi:hypothetical protein A2U01_0061971, partial [Trifolium medium]|nr:hypothetical protein [Trifolium medium]